MHVYQITACSLHTFCIKNIIIFIWHRQISLETLKKLLTIRFVILSKKKCIIYLFVKPCFSFEDHDAVWQKKIKQIMLEYRISSIYRSGQWSWQKEPIQRLCLWPWFTPTPNRLIPSPKGYLHMMVRTQTVLPDPRNSTRYAHYSRKTQTYISQNWEHLMTTKSFQIPSCRTYELTWTKITPTKQKFGTVGEVHWGKGFRRRGSELIYQPLWMSSSPSGIPKFGSEGRDLSREITLCKTVA